MKSLSLFVGLMLIQAATAFACKCAPPFARTPRELAEAQILGTPVIFSGTVDKIEMAGFPLKPEPGKTVSLLPVMLVTFSDVQVYRGGQRKQFTVETGIGMGDCGYHFDTGESYLVYADVSGSGSLATSICSGTTLFDDAGADLRVLRGEPPLAQDLVDRRNAAEDPPKSTPAGDRLCSKITIPAGAKPDDIRVYLWRAEKGANPLPVDEADHETDGSYCFRSVDPGKYVVAAFASNPGAETPAYASYYPGVPDRTKAQPVVIDRGGALVRVDFPLLRPVSYRVRGYVRGAPANREGKLYVMLQHNGFEFPPIVQPALLGLHGSFELINVPKGNYSAFAIRENEDDTVTFLSEAIQIAVHSNVDGVAIQFVPKR